MVGPRPPRPRTLEESLNSQLTMDQPGRVINPELRSLNELIRAGQAFNQERDFRASPNHRPRKVIGMYNVAQAYTERGPTMDRDIDNLEQEDVKQVQGGLQNASSNVPMKELDTSGMPEEFKGRPKLKYLWLSGQGKLSSKQQKMLDKAMEDGHMNLSDEDWIALQSVMPTSPVKDMEGPQLEALMKAKPEEADQYLKTLVADAYRKKEVDKVMEGLRTTSIGLGATFGGLIGTSGGPGGIIAGGSLGAAGGSSFVDGLENATKMVLDKLYPTGEENETGRYMPVKDIAKRATTEALIDLGASTAGVYAPFVAAKMKQKMLGITKDSMALKQAGKNIGVDMLPLQVGRPLLGSYTNVLGRVPFIGPPIRKRMIAQNAQIASFTDSLPGRISAKKLTDQDVGVFLDIKAQETFEKHMQDLSNRQIKLKAAARKQGAFIPMTETAAVAQKWLDKYSTSDFVSTDKHIIKKMQTIVDLAGKGKITMDKWDDDLMTGLRMEIDKLDGGEGTKAMMELMQAARLDLAGSGVHGMRQLGMDKAWEAGLRRFESVAAKKFMLTDRSRFKQGVMKLGTRNPDELVGLLIGGQSPTFVHDVRGIVGDEAMADLASRYMDRQLKASQTLGKGGIIKTDWDALEKSLGLDNVKGGRFGVTKEMLRSSGVTPDMLQEFMKVGRAASKVEVPDVSTFLSRRVAIAGAAAGIGALTGIFGPQSMGTGLALTLVARHGSKIISNPENVRLATLALDANTDQAVRRTSLMRLYRLLMTDRAVEGDQPIEPAAEPEQSPFSGGPQMRLPPRFNAPSADDGS